MANTSQNPQNLPAETMALAIQTMDITAVSEAMQELGHGGMTPFDLDRIAFPTAGALTYNVPTEDGMEPMKFLDAIIVHQHPGRQYYPDKYDPQNPKPPQCASYDGLIGIGDPGGSCTVCPFCVFGCGCNPYKYLYLLFPEESWPKLLVLPRTSLSKKILSGPAIGMSKYGMALAKRGKRMSDVVTRIGLMPRTQGIGSVATFQVQQELPKALADCVRAYAAAFKESLTFPTAITRAQATVEPPEPGMMYGLDEDEDDI